MDKYKSWSGLSKQLSENLCDALRERITYFLTRYHDVRNCYGRAAIRLDGKEVVCFSWIEGYRNAAAINELYSFSKSTMSNGLSYEEAIEKLKSGWDENCSYSETDFLDAVLRFRNMSIRDALKSDDYIVKSLAVLDKRVGRRTLEKIEEEKACEQYPPWVRQFYDLRFSVSR